MNLPFKLRTTFHSLEFLLYHDSYSCLSVCERVKKIQQQSKLFADNLYTEMVLAA